MNFSDPSTCPWYKLDCSGESDIGYAGICCGGNDLCVVYIRLMAVFQIDECWKWNIDWNICLHMRLKVNHSGTKSIEK